MKIEIDTDKASKDEMAHAAALLSALAGQSNPSVSQSGLLNRDVNPGQQGFSGSSSQISDSGSASGGLFSLFDDDSSQSSSAGISGSNASVPAPSPEPASGGLFSLFNDSGLADQSRDVPGESGFESHSAQDDSLQQGHAESPPSGGIFGLFENTESQTPQQQSEHSSSQDYGRTSHSVFHDPEPVVTPFFDGLPGNSLKDKILGRSSARQGLQSGISDAMVKGVSDGMIEIKAKDDDSSTSSTAKDILDDDSIVPY